MLLGRGSTCSRHGTKAEVHQGMYSLQYGSARYNRAALMQFSSPLWDPPRRTRLAPSIESVHLRSWCSLEIARYHVGTHDIRHIYVVPKKLSSGFWTPWSISSPLHPIAGPAPYLHTTARRTTSLRPASAALTNDFQSWRPEWSNTTHVSSCRVHHLVMDGWTPTMQPNVTTLHLSPGPNPFVGLPAALTLP